MIEAYEIYKEEQKAKDFALFIASDYQSIKSRQYSSDTDYKNACQIADEMKFDYLGLTFTVTNKITEEEQANHLNKYKGLSPKEFINKLRTGES